MLRASGANLVQAVCTALEVPAREARRAAAMERGEVPRWIAGNRRVGSRKTAGLRRRTAGGLAAGKEPGASLPGTSFRGPGRRPGSAPQPQAAAVVCAQRGFCPARSAASVPRAAPLLSRAKRGSLNTSTCADPARTLRTASRCTGVAPRNRHRGYTLGRRSALRRDGWRGRTKVAGTIRRQVPSASFAMRESAPQWTV